jgi:hypothetical protein
MLGALALAVTLAAAPDWVTGMPRAFPREKFVTAVGIADERPAAEARARAGVAAFFETAVTSVTRVREAEGEVTTQGRTEVAGVAVSGKTELRTASLAAEQEVTAVSARLLAGVEIVDRWTDPAGRFHALAALDRARGVALLRGRLAELDAEVAALAARLPGTPAGFARARVAHRLVGAVARRAPVAADLSVLAPGAGPELPRAAAGAREAAERALAAVGVAILASGDDADRLRTAAARAVVSTGMRAAALDGDRELTVNVEQETAAPAAAEGWTSVRVTARIRILDARQETVGTFVETAKGTSGREEEAARRAGEALAARVEERLRAELGVRLEAP